MHSSDRIFSQRVIFRMLVWATVLAVHPLLSASPDPNPPSIHSEQGAWVIRRQWTPAETQHYAKWMQNLYYYKTRGTVEQRMARVPEMLGDPQMNLLLQPDFAGEGCNPQLPANIIRSVNSMIDCGRFTAFLPAYYAYRRALPWMYTYVSSHGKGDVRNAPKNFPSGYKSNFDSPSLYDFFVEGLVAYSSGNYRVDLVCPRAEWSDTVPVAIDPQYLLPGCVNYVDGHCLLLADVTPYGELQFLNASTTKTRDIYSYNAMNAVFVPAPADDANSLEGCFQGLRVFRYPIAETDSRGKVTRVRRRTNEEMKAFGFSTEQYEVVRKLAAHEEITVGGIKPQSFHDYIRLKMKSVDKIVPLEFMEKYADELLEAYKIRAEFVDEAWREVLKNGPITYPAEKIDENIFQAHGRWETWSSPSSDVDRRNKYFYLIDWVDYAIRCFGMMPSFVDLRGLERYTIRSQADLCKALMEEKKRIFQERYIVYTKSNGEKVKLTLADIEERLYDLSFDPNHPPELRWGAPPGSEERAGAPERPTPVPNGPPVPMEEAYRLEAFYRAVGQRETTPSYLRGMYSEGFPMRSKFEEQLAGWLYATEPTEALARYFAETSGNSVGKNNQTSAGPAT